MPRNVEIKARARNLAVIREIAAAISQSAPIILIQRDTFFGVPKGRLKLREIDGKSAELIYYERPNQPGPKLSTYSRSPISDPDSMRKTLELSLGVRAIVEKRREVYSAGSTRIHLDQVKDLGDFLELEVVLADEDSIPEGERTARSVMEALGVGSDDLVSEAYLELLEER